MNNLIVGLWFNRGSNLKTADRGGIYYSLTSLRRVNTDCRVVIMCYPTDICNVLVDFCKSKNAELFPVLVDKFDRCISAYNLILQLNVKYNKILLSDLDDVIYQEDPFGFDIDNGLYGAAEESMFREISNPFSETNMAWVWQCNFLTDEQRKSIYNKHVVCAGTILGYHDAIIDFLEYYNTVNKTKEFCDQGILNVYVNIHKKLDVVDYRKSKILTCEGIKLEALRKNDKGQIINDNNELYAIIHQYNRCDREYFCSLVDSQSENMYSS